MIFVTLGSQKFQFNRLLKEIDTLVEEGIIKEEVFAQTGYSDYKPKNFRYKNFLDQDKFKNIMNQCDKVITHGGTGVIINAIKKQKKVIAIPRLSQFKEHVDDHQLQIVDEFNNMGFILSTKHIEELKDLIDKLNYFKSKKYVSNTENIIESIELFINSK